MKDPVSRRVMLGTTLVSATMVLGGCITGGNGEETDAGAADWPAPGYDPANTGYSPSGTVRTGEVGENWTKRIASGRVGAIAVLDGTVYAGSDRGRRSEDSRGVLAAMDGDGNEVWSFEAESPLDNTIAVTSDGSYVTSDDGVLYALDPGGEVRWTVDVGAEATVTTTADRTYALGEGSAISALTPDGAVEWEYGPDGGSVRGLPAVGQSGPYAGGNSVVALDGDGDRRWTYGRSDFVYGTPAVTEDRVYALAFARDGTGMDPDRDRFLVALEGGDDPAWRTRVPGGRSLAVTGDSVLVSAEERVVAVDVSDGSQRWAYDCFKPSAPSVGDDVAWVGSWDDSLHAVDVESGERRGHYEFEAAVTSRPAVVGGAVYVGTRDGIVHALTA